MCFSSVTIGRFFCLPLIWPQREPFILPSVTGSPCYYSLLKDLRPNGTCTVMMSLSLFFTNWTHGREKGRKHTFGTRWLTVEALVVANNLMICKGTTWLLVSPCESSSSAQVLESRATQLPCGLLPGSQGSPLGGSFPKDAEEEGRYCCS